jgi:TRAP transporter TAXI family solute receptor
MADYVGNTSSGMLQFVAAIAAFGSMDRSTRPRPPALRTLAAVLALAIPLTACLSVRGTSNPVAIRITTGLPGMTFKSLGESLVTSYARLLPDLRFSVVETAGSVSNLQLLQQGGAELGFALADVSYMAYNGHIAEVGAPLRNVRALGVLHSSVVHVITPKGSPVHSISQLRGNIGVGPPGSGTAVTATLLLNAFGVPRHQVRERALPFMDAADALARGELNASFVVAADPVDAVRRATDAGAGLLDVVGPTVLRLRTEYPFLRPARILGRTYPGIRRPVDTLLVDVLLLCRADLDDQLVQRLTAALFEILPALAPANEFLRTVDVRRAPAAPIPLHPGAAFYYREGELAR